MSKLVLDIIAEVVEVNGKVDLEFEDGKKFSEVAPNLSIEIIKEDGPAGGWPEVRIIGEKEFIEKFLRDFYCYDEDDFNWRRDDIEA